MTKRIARRWLAAAAGALLVVAAVVAGFVLRETSRLPPRPPGERPPLMLLTSLPIAFPEEFTLDAEPSAALEALRSRYAVVPISVADAGTLRQGRLLLMAQPRAQPPEALVELDSWVRGGGRVLLLADPALERPSDGPLGERLRPPAAFADTGLLARWGLRLDAPDRRGAATREVGGREVETVSPGTLVATGRSCRIAARGLVARCRIGRGAATVIADADLLDSEAAGSGNLDVLLHELARLER